MKKMKQLTALELPPIVKNALVLVVFLIVFDILLAVVGTYIGGAAGFFFSNSTVTTLSNLIFLEGAAMLTIGALIEFAESSRREKSSDEAQNEKVSTPQKSLDRIMRRGSFTMILGAGLIVLSIIVGLLPS